MRCFLLAVVCGFVFVALVPAVCCSLVVARCALFVVRCVLLFVVVCCLLLVDWCLSYRRCLTAVVRGWLLVVCLLVVVC